MIKIICMLLILISTPACGTNFIRFDHVHSGVAPEFKETAEYFYTLTGIIDRSTTIGFVPEIPMPFTNTVLGLTNKVINGGAEIDISKKEWGRLSYGERDFLVLHELGHAVCHLPHTDYNENFFVRLLERAMVLFHYMKIKPDYFDGCPSNIMSTLMPSTMCIQKHYLDYMVSLQKGCSNAQSRN